jgi:ankyrin repeat protein
MPADHYSTLAQQAYDGNVGTISRLLQKGWNPNGSEDASSTPLAFAAERAHIEIMELLVQHGATIPEPESVRTTALHQATRYGRTEAARR